MSDLSLLCPHVIVIGAGLAGLYCARELAEAGCAVEVLEAAHRVGGRVATDRVEGFTLDRGFQSLPDRVPGRPLRSRLRGPCAAAAVLPDAQLEELVREQLSNWLGLAARGWRHLRTYRIAHALPEQSTVTFCTPEHARTSRRNVYACGDHLDAASINGALRSGGLAAEAVIADLLNSVATRAA